MTRSVYLVGPPGVGKTSALTGAVRLTGLTPAASAAVIDPRWKMLRGHALLRGGLRAGVLLGVTRAAFSGTDALSMAVNPQAVAWATEGRLPGVVVGEGQRLATASFLGALGARSDLTVVHLRADDVALAERRAARGSDQNETWMRAAATRAANVVQAARDAGLDVHEADTSATSLRDVAVLLAEILARR